MPDAPLARFGSISQINPPGGYLGPTLASAATLVISAPAHKVTGTVSITSITPPYDGFVGWITLLPTGAAPFATGGNIAAALTATANVPVWAFYDGAAWFLK